MLTASASRTASSALACCSAWASPAWRCAAEDRLPGQDIAELHEEIDAMVESLIMTPAKPEGVALH